MLLHEGIPALADWKNIFFAKNEMSHYNNFAI